MRIRKGDEVRSVSVFLPVRYRDRWGVVSRVSNGMVHVTYPVSTRASELVGYPEDFIVRRNGKVLN